MADKVVLAYSGGLDTSVAIPWIKENYGYEVIALAVDLSGGENVGEALERARNNGAAEATSIDASDEFASEYIARAIKANALYEDKYPLATALGRPLIVKYLVAKAHETSATAVAHGCTGKGNDQVRFDVGIRALDPALKIIAPIREWGMTREQEIDYAAERGLKITVDKDKVYSVDANLWGRAIEGGELEDPQNEPSASVFSLTAEVNKTPDEPAYAEVMFEAGLPVGLNGSRMALKEIIVALNKLAGAHGFGRIDMIENRLVGIKSREIYEAPAALSILAAHKALEDLTLERDVLHYKKQAESAYAEAIYDGKWYSPLREALDAFFESVQATVKGSVTLKFHKGNLVITGRESENSLYDYGLATYADADAFSHDAAAGFVELYGLALTEWAKKTKNQKPKTKNEKP
ncbi:MAG: argininosuccinate synthase [Actinomycetota bacterium]